MVFAVLVFQLLFKIKGWTLSGARVFTEDLVLKTEKKLKVVAGKARAMRYCLRG